MAKSTHSSVDRRGFLRRAAGGAAALASAQSAGHAQAAPEVLTTDRPGADFMTEVLKSLGFEFVCANPGSSFRGLHESLVNYGGNRNPELITCCHEESAVAMAHGYAKIEGKPLCVLAHGTVGLQHAAMAIYNAYCDRVPVYLILGNLLDATSRRPGAEWNHSVQDAAAMVRDYIKWDDLPVSLPHFAESAVRAYQIAMTPPRMPVVIVADGDLQENPMPPRERPHIPKLTIPAAPQGDAGAIAETARMLVEAGNPVLVAGRAVRTQAGVAQLIQLAETLGAPVIDQGERMNFPTRHPLNHSARARQAIADADIILGLELPDFWGTVHSFRDQLQRSARRIAKADARLIRMSTGNLCGKGNYQDLQRFPEVDLAMVADVEATLPLLIEAVERRITASRRSALRARAGKLAAAHQHAMERSRSEAIYAWDSSPISTARLSAELWAQIQNQDWSLVSAVSSLSNWPLRLWTFERPWQFIGGAGGHGIGYGAPAATGAALANRKHGRLSISFQNDGDLMYAPGILWTAAHHRIPLLSVVHNNRAYHQEVMHIQRMANRHNRGITNANIGTTLENPGIDFARIAQGMGVHAEGPIADPKDLAPAIRRALEVVRRGEPALVDVITQPR